MEKIITNLHIKNFKSIKELDLNCKRINVFVGKPNTGKSNILEALSLFCAPFDNYGSKILGSNIRYEQFSNLFYDDEIGDPVEVLTDFGSTYLNWEGNTYWFFSSNGMINIMDYKNSENKGNYFRTLNGQNIDYVNNFLMFGMIDEEGRVNGNHYTTIDSKVKKYTFKNTEFGKGRHYLYLTPPFGDNLPSIIKTKSSLREYISSYFKDYGLDFVLSKKDNNVEIQKRIGNLAWKYPYSLTSDTLQRMIFYLAAIKSNKDSILLFEEPEAHTFPSYTAELADEIVESKDNQFFITTHNPYLLNEILENSNYEETAVFKVTYKDYQTHAQELTDDEINDISSYGADVFINHKAFGE